MLVTCTTHVIETTLQQLREAGQRGLMVAAQVHSHPQEAFHSKADDRWAIVRHEGALSLVVPDCALDTSVARLLGDTKIYQFSAAARWTEVPREEVTRSWLQIS